MGLVYSTSGNLTFRTGRESNVESIARFLRSRVDFICVFVATTSNRVIVVLVEHQLLSTSEYKAKSRNPLLPNSNDCDDSKHFSVSMLLLMFQV